MHVTKAGVYRAGFFDRFSLAQQKDNLMRLTWLKLDRSLDRCAWIQPRAIATTKADASQSRRRGQRSVTTDEFLSIAGHGEAALAGAGKRDAVGELVVIRVAGEDCAFILFQIRDQMRG